MSRFESFSYERSETRRVLRDRLGRMLRPTSERDSRARGESSCLADVDLLQLLLHVRIVHADDSDDVRAAYEAHRAAHPESPAFDALLDEGWFGIAWGRITTELNARVPARNQSGPRRGGLNVIFDTRNQDSAFVFDDVASLTPAAQTVAARLAAHPERIHVIPARSPDWIAARLWEQRPQDGDAAALRWWVDRWLLLGEPVGAPSKWWAQSDADRWRRAAIEVLRNDPGLIGWEREQALIDARPTHHKRRLPTPPIPKTQVERHLWLHDGTHLDHWARALESCGDTWVLLALLCEDLVAHDRELEGPSTAELLELVVDRPTLLVLLATRIERQPAILADMLLHPPTSALASLIIANWKAQPIGAWERSLQNAENGASRELVFGDAATILAEHVRAGTRSVDEVAQLLVWMHACVREDDHEPARCPRTVTERMLVVMQSELQTLAKTRLEAILAALSFRESDGLGTPRFTAALDVASTTALAESINSDEVVAAYVAALRADVIPYAVALTPSQAATLALAASKSSTAWTNFLAPFDVAERLATSKLADNEFVARDEIARAMRAHIRVLSRAVAGWEGVAPTELIQALASAIRAGSTDHYEKGRVGAFAARHETLFAAPRVEPPLVDDVAAAYRCLPEATRRVIDDALLLVDEPHAFARLLQSAPTAMRERVRARVDALTPDDAAPIQSLTEMQARIEELLNAGATAAAARYIGVERDLKTLGRVAGREVVRLRWQLRIALLQRDFAGIAEVALPDGLDRSEVAPAQDAINFYKGLAQIDDSSGSASTAESLFAGLARRHPENAAYVVNLFAARLARLFGGDVFKRLGSADISIAREALNEADRALEAALGASARQNSIHECNRALALLAVGQHRDAYAALQRDSAGGKSDTVVAYSAVALARMGRAEEARVILAAGEAIDSGSEVLKAARQHVEVGRPAGLRVPVVGSDDNVIAIKGALFELSQMDPSVQARVITGRTFDAHMTEEIRAAAAGVTALVPHLRRVRLEEDDVTAVLLRILEPRARLFGWSVPDQSRGGFSARGNPGERDLVLRKNGAEICVIEAVVCQSNPATKTMRKKLTSHFQKLFGYGESRVLIHVVYSYFAAPHDVVASMHDIAKSRAPSEFTFVRAEDLPHEDSRPIGFLATYSAPGASEVKVACLVMDMRQQAQRDAAALAGRTLASKAHGRASGARRRGL